jgi:hypothetical protein
VEGLNLPTFKASNFVFIFPAVEDGLPALLAILFLHGPFNLGTLLGEWHG